MRILVVEHEPAVRDTVRRQLSASGFAVDCVDRADEALAIMGIASYDAIVLDLDLPECNRLELVSIQSSLSAGTTRMIVTSAKRSPTDRVQALNAGADDFLMKPFDVSELEARIRAVLRRSSNSLSSVHARGRLVFDPKRRAARVGDCELELTRREASLLEELMRADRTIAKGHLEECLYSFEDNISSLNALEATVSRLRKKLASAGAGLGIRSKRGVGYRLYEDNVA